MEFFNLRLKAKFAEFLQNEGWKNLSPRHGHEDDDDGEVEGEGGDDDGEGTGGGDGNESVGAGWEDAPAVRVDGQTVSWEGVHFIHCLQPIRNMMGFFFSH